MDVYQHVLEQTQEILLNTFRTIQEMDKPVDQEKQIRGVKKEESAAKGEPAQQTGVYKMKKTVKQKKPSQKQKSRECVTVNEREQPVQEQMIPPEDWYLGEIKGVLAPDWSGADIQPVYGLPVRRAVLQKIRQFFKARTISEEVYKQISASEEDISFDNAQFFISKAIPNLLVEDPYKTGFIIQHLPLRWGMHYSPVGGTEAQYVTPLKMDEGINWRLPKKEEAGTVSNCFLELYGRKYTVGNYPIELTCITLYCPHSDPTQAMNIYTKEVVKFGDVDAGGSIDIHVAELPEKSLLCFILKNGLVPSFCTEEIKQRLHSLYSMQKAGVFKFETDENGGLWVVPGKEKLLELLKEEDPREPLDKPENLDSTVSLVLPDGIKEECIKYLLSLDEVRADITPEDPRRLEDPNGGIWELWEEPREGWELAGLSAPVYARNPRLDVLNSGVVGIDFGTKSTVVVALNGESGGEAILPVRVGTGRYEQQIHGQDYENPTVEAFIDLEQFKADYERDPGRPLTHWSDLTISYTAAMDRENQPDTRYYASYFSELKQWAGDSRRNVRVRDQRAVREQGEGVDQMLPPYLELKPGDMDPIEYYAYYIGLYINNMRTRRIYLEYLLSFPVTYSREVRDRILESFRRGLKRSLPRSIQEDPVYSGRFSVAEGAGEPAAYAVCALQEYGFAPRPGEKVYFGIFDFGGGTTDFDFGLWRRAEGARERRYRYVIEHFGDSGDRYLGGENLLGKLAYYVFWENRDQLLQERISFTRPPEEPERPGSELLVTDSQEAHTNTRRLVEALRPLWERHSDYQRRYADGILKIDLYRADGSSCPVELRVDAETLEKLLRDRIQKGVREFFQAFRSIFDQDKPYGDSMKQLRKINLFLAGNSSKSEILQSVFQEEMKRENEWISNLLEEAGQTLEDEEIFELFYPLGTEESEEQLRQRTGGEEPQRVFRPSGKTGVAVGLLQCREGGKIKVINRQKVQGSERAREIPFRYWIGDGDDDGMFRKVLSRDSAYGQWEEYYDAGTRMFEFYCTTSPSAQFVGTLPVGGCRLFRQDIPESAVNEDWIICLRPVGPDRLEYAVAESLEAATQGELKCEVMAVDLSIS